MVWVTDRKPAQDRSNRLICCQKVSAYAQIRSHRHDRQPFAHALELAEWRMSAWVESERSEMTFDFGQRMTSARSALKRAIASAGFATGVASIIWSTNAIQSGAKVVRADFQIAR